MKKAIVLQIISIAFCSQAVAKDIAKSCEQIGKYEEFMLQSNTMQATFKQFINGKYNSGGEFFMKKPNKMLINYNDGEINAFIGINGKIATYLDKDLEQISHIPENKTPAHFILGSKTKLSDMKLEKCEKIANIYRIYFSEDTSVASGKFALDFTEINNDIKLTTISVTDKSNQKIELAFEDIKRNIEINDKIFIIKDPRL